MWQAYILILVSALVLPAAGTTTSSATRAPFSYHSSWAVPPNPSSHNIHSSSGPTFPSYISFNETPSNANATAITSSTLSPPFRTSSYLFSNTSSLMLSVPSSISMESPTATQGSSALPVATDSARSSVDTIYAYGTTNSRVGTPTTDRSSLATSVDISRPSTPKFTSSGTSTPNSFGTLPPLSNFTIPPLPFRNITGGPSWLSLPPPPSNTETGSLTDTITATEAKTTDDGYGLDITAPDFADLGGWTPTVTSGAVTAAAVNFSFELFSNKPHTTATKTAADNSAPTADALSLFKALVPQMVTSASIFNQVEDAVGGLSHAVSDSSSTDSSIASAGSGLFSLLGNAFSSGARIGKALSNIELDDLDSRGNVINQGNIINVVDQIQTELYDLGTMINNVEPLLKAQLNKKNAKLVLKILLGTTAANVLKINLQKLANWSFGPPKAPNPPEMPTPTTKPTQSSVTSTSSSTSSSATETLKEWCIVTERGTTIAQYEAFVNSLPDGGKGRKMVFPNLDSQVYTTFLSDAEIAKVEKNPIISGYEHNTSGAPEEFDDDGYRAVPRSEQPSIQDRTVEMKQARVPGSPDHLRLISQGPKSVHDRESRTIPFEPLPDYVLSPKAGEGTTIYVIDSGIDPGHTEYARSYDPNHFYCVPNSEMALPEKNIKGEPYVPVPDNVMQDTRNHGQCVASLATGIISGVAKKSRLVPVRHRNTQYQLTQEAIQNAWRLGNNKLLSFGRHNGLYDYPGGAWARRKGLMQKLLKECWDNDIVTIIAAGNQGSSDDYDLSQDVPACLGTSENALITVGASDINGQRWPETTKDVGKGGSISIWAQGDNIQCAAQGDQGFQREKGTSFAAPQIAGLAAYFMSLAPEELPWISQNQQQAPYLTPPDLHVKGKVSKAVKDYLVALSYPRTPDGPNIGYNGAEYNLCEVVPGTSITKRQLVEDPFLDSDEFGFEPILNRRDSSASVCSLSSGSSIYSSTRSSISSSTPSLVSSSTSSLIAPLASHMTSSISFAPSSSSVGTATPTTPTTTPSSSESPNSLLECFLDFGRRKTGECLPTHPAKSTQSPPPPPSSPPSPPAPSPPAPSPPAPSPPPPPAPAPPKSSKPPVCIPPVGMNIFPDCND